jgi:hypothetical protein
MSRAFNSSIFRSSNRRQFLVGTMWLSSFVVLVTACIVRGRDEEAVETLAHIPLFAFGGIGIAGTTSNGEAAFHNVFESRNAAADFAQILKTGTPQAQCYALVGLRLKDRAAFDEQVKRFASSKQEVQTCAGCMMSKQPMSSVVANINKGWYDDRGKSGLPKR